MSLMALYSDSFYNKPGLQYNQVKIPNFNNEICVTGLFGLNINQSHRNTHTVSQQA